MNGTAPDQALDRDADAHDELDTFAPLRARRDFLLRSLADLEAEHASGELPAERYQQLHDDYTVQAATVLKALAQVDASVHEGPHPAPPLGAPRRRHLSPIVMLSVLAIIVLGGVLLTKAVGGRTQGQTITGNAQSTETDLETLARAVRARPDDANAQLDYGQALLQARRASEALKAFDAAARLDPSDPAAKAYGGMVVYLAGLVDESIRRLDAAVAVDPSYPDARFFRGLVHLRGRNDPATALVDLQEYLRLVPPGPERDQVQALVAEIEGANVDDGAPAPAPPTSSPPEP